MSSTYDKIATKDAAMMSITNQGKGSTATASSYKVLHNDMNDELIQHAIELTLDGVEKSLVEKDIATYLKKEFEIKYGKDEDGNRCCWQVICGDVFGCSLTHKTKTVMSFQVVKPLSTLHVFMYQSA